MNQISVQLNIYHSSSYDGILLGTF